MKKVLTNVGLIKPILFNCDPSYTKIKNTAHQVLVASTHKENPASTLKKTTNVKQEAELLEISFVNEQKLSLFRGRNVSQKNKQCIIQAVVHQK